MPEHIAGRGYARRVCQLCATLALAAAGLAAAGAWYQAATRASGVRYQLWIAIIEVMLVLAITAAVIGVLAGVAWVLLPRAQGAAPFRGRGAQTDGDEVPDVEVI